MNNELNDQMKKDLREVKTKEELDAVVSSAGFELDDDELDAVAGGGCCSVVENNDNCSPDCLIYHPGMVTPEDWEITCSTHS